MNISNFIGWFINQFVYLGTQIFQILDNIIIYGSVSLIDFIISLIILTMFLEIILTIPSIANRQGAKYERKQRAKERSQK